MIFQPLFILYTATIAPYFFWYLHMKNVYASYPQLHSADLISPGNWLKFNKLLDIHWLVNTVYDFIDQVATLPVIILFLGALLLKNRRNFGFIIAWSVGLAIYVLGFIGKIHFWYYQVPLLFPVVILAGVSANELLQYFKKHFVHSKIVIIFLIAISMFLTGRPYLLRTYAISLRHKHLLEFAQTIQNETPLHGKILTSADTHAALTYYSLRPDMWGGTLTINEPGCDNKCVIHRFEGFRAWGAQLYAVLDKKELTGKPEFSQYLHRHFPVVKESETYILFSVVRKA